MPLPSNVYRRGAVYWWRRTLHLAVAPTAHISLALSLLTRELGIARGRAAAMTARSETVRMSLYEQIAREGLTEHQQQRLLIDEMTLYRNALVHEVARWEADPRLRVFDTDRDLQAFETLWRTFAKTGIVEKPSRAFAEEHFVELDEEEAARLRRLLLDTPNLRANFESETQAALARIDVTPTPTSLALAGKLVMIARMTGTQACRQGAELVAPAPSSSASVSAGEAAAEPLSAAPRSPQAGALVIPCK